MNDPQTSRRGFWARTVSFLRMLSDGVLVAMLLLFGISALLVIVHAANRRFRPPPALDPRLLASVHPHLNASQIRAMLDETYFQEPFVYSPFTGFKERPRTGAFVSVSPQGFRLGAEPRQDIRAAGTRKVCLFGGSTVFGYGVDDRHTIGAYLQAQLNAHHPQKHYSVFNFGRAAYYSAQEAALFQELVINGVHCDVALFVDGVNEHMLAPKFTDTQSILYAAYNYSLPAFFMLGLQRTALLSDISSRLAHPAPAAEPSVDGIIRGYRKAQEVETQLGAISGTRVLFVVQPMPGFRNRFADFAFQSGGCPSGSPCRAFTYARIQAMAALADGKTVYDLTGLFAQTRDLPFLDDVHYTPAANGQIARALEPLIAQGE